MFPDFSLNGGYFSSEALMAATFFASNAGLFLAFRYFGAVGITTYGTVAILTANIQVLKTTPCAWFPEPVALGTIVFSSLYLASDMLTEFYGAQTAKKVVWIHFSAQLFFVLWMLLTLAYPTTPDPCQVNIQKALLHLFSPTPSIIAASLLAYLISQRNDIWIFAALKRLTEGRELWLRTSLSNLLSGFLDHALFSFFAWVIFAKEPMAWGTLWWSYILGAYAIRAFILLLHTPLMYLAKRIQPQEF